MSYWTERDAKTREKLSKKSEKKIKKQLIKYYQATAKQVIEDFENTYNKLLATIADGREPTPADLYKLDKYWQLQGQIRQELTKLGEKEVVLLTKEFETNFFEVYYSWAEMGDKAFNTLDTESVQKLVNGVWCVDGKTFSQRIWENTQGLIETLDAQLIHCVATGKKTTELKHMLMERFGVSYSRAETLVRTELAHIQVEAAKKRYEDYGFKKYRILGNTDDTCGNSSPDCAKMDGKEFYFAEMKAGVNAPPFHPNCKCDIVPVVD